MTIKRYTATLDNTITNAYKENLTTRGTQANMGASDVLEVFRIYNQVGSVKAKANLYISASHGIAVNNSQQIELSSSDTLYTFIASNAAAVGKFDASGTRSAVLSNISDIINTSASADFAAVVEGTYVKISAANSGSTGNTFTLSSSLSNSSPTTATLFTGGEDNSENARTLIQFDTAAIAADRLAEDIPASGSVDFYLRVHNAPHGQTLPKDYNLTVHAVSRSWEEGYGLDMEGYKDADASNWISSSQGQSWDSEGGDFHLSPVFTQAISDGTEDVEVNITELVEQWLAGTKQNYGVCVKLSSTNETDLRSFYTKKFFARGSEYFYLKPKIEARWGASVQDNRNTFYASSSLVPAADNLNSLYIYNRVRGQLQNIPAVGTGSVYVSMYSGSSTAPVGEKLTLHDGNTAATGSWVSKGIYKADIAIDTTSSYLYDVWHDNALTASEYVTGSQITVRSFVTETSANTGEFVSNIVNLKDKYSQSEKSRMRLFIRDKNWNPNIYTVATTNIETKIIEDAYFKVSRIADDFEVISYGTGSSEHTKLSYDKDGNYFDLDMSMFEKGYSYGIKFLYKNIDRYEEQPELF